MPVIVEDTRNQLGKHKEENAYFEEHGFRVVRSKMLVGDYMIANKGDIVIDTKKDILELFMDLGKDHKRFRRECELARASGIQLIVLTEELPPEKGLSDWKSPVFRSSNSIHQAGDPKSKANPQTMLKIMQTMQEKYGVVFIFCRKQDAGERIIYFLTGGSYIDIS